MLYDAFNRRIPKPDRFIGFGHTPMTREAPRLDPDSGLADAIGYEISIVRPDEPKEETCQLSDTV